MALGHTAWTEPSAFGVANCFSLIELAETDGFDTLDGHIGAQIDGPVRFDSEVIGDAARTGRYDPRALKRVWHCLARFGSPSRANAETRDPSPACCSLGTASL
ncbi:hypothetical protein [Streptomyces sp. HPF1205]|uniref:hypothetical protein n=1 Tax=Streptomyces sp. HPF1205 TaxID=2873262 RepID=UPI001CEC9C2E|nr:hypothetical protein [Streptomyces sp. HPF1205]